MSRALTDALTKLVAANGKLASTQLTPAQRDALASLARQTGCVSQSPQGRGSVYQVMDWSRVELELKSLRPISTENLPNNLPKRSTNLALYRDSKSQAHGHDVYYLLMKAIGSSVFWQHEDGRCLDVAEMTRTAGVGSLMISALDNWSSQQALLLVETQALFDNLSWLPADATGTVVYYAGNIHGVLLDWLAHKPRCSELILFPDYDGVGLANYMRLFERVGQRVQFWLMPNWQQKLQQMGSRELWIKNRPLFDSSLEKLRCLGVDGDIWQLVDCMRSAAMALEQETVFFDNQQVNNVLAGIALIP